MPHVRLDPITADPRVHHLPEREVRLARVEVKPSAVADLIEVFGDSAVSWLAETTGFGSALLFADPGSGHLISESVWWDARRGQQARASPLLRPVRTAYEAPAADPNLIRIV
jgi:hypothetical protein